MTYDAPWYESPNTVAKTPRCLMFSLFDSLTTKLLLRLWTAQALEVLVFDIPFWNYFGRVRIKILVRIFDSSFSNCGRNWDICCKHKMSDVYTELAHTTQDFKEIHSRSNYQYVEKNRNAALCTYLSNAWMPRDIFCHWLKIAQRGREMF